MTPSSADEMSDEKPSRPHEGRKSSKPLMEKRRRARINDCLTELQSILDALNPEGNGTRQNKREKADILEQTVKLVKQLRQHAGRGNQMDHHSQVQFRAGFNECMATVTQFLSANQGSLNGEAKAGLMSHLANSLQCNKPYADRLPHPSRRRPDEAANSMSASVKPQATSSQSEAAENTINTTTASITNGSSSSSLNVVHPMPAAATAAVTSASSHSTVSVPVGLPCSMQGALPSLTARLELTSNGGNSSNATRIVPIALPIKVQSPGQFILVSPQMFNGGQIIPVLSPPTANLGSSPPSSAGSSGSVAISPSLGQQSPQKASPQLHSTAASASAQGAIMYASCPAALGAPGGASTSTLQPATPYPVAFVAMGDPSEAQNGAQLEHLVYPNIPRFYVPANPPSASDPVWRPW